MFDGDGLSKIGRELLENMLIGKCFESNPDAVRMISNIPSMRQSVITALSEIINNKQLGKDYSLESELAEAIELVYRARQAGTKLGESVSLFARQTELFPDVDADAVVADYKNLTMLMMADLLNDARATQLRKILAVYNMEAVDAAIGQADLFTGTVDSKEDILKRVIERFNNATRRQQESELTAAREKRKGQSVQQDGTTPQSDTTSGRGGEDVRFKLKDPIGGNSGYVGYSISKRGASAKEEGRYPKTQFCKEYGITKRSLDALTKLGYINNKEWHHTSMYGNRTVFYGWDNDNSALIYQSKKQEVDKLSKGGDLEAIKTLMNTELEKYDEYGSKVEELKSIVYEANANLAQVKKQAKNNVLDKLIKDGTISHETSQDGNSSYYYNAPEGTLMFKSLNSVLNELPSKVSKVNEAGRELYGSRLMELLKYRLHQSLDYSNEPEYKGAVLALNKAEQEFRDKAQELRESYGVTDEADGVGSDNSTRFRFIGEKGATNADRAEQATWRLDNLTVARDMEEQKKDAKTIKLATGWERGADGKWRYEVSDFEFHADGNARFYNFNKWMEKMDYPWWDEYIKEGDSLFERKDAGEDVSTAEWEAYDAKWQDKVGAAQARFEDMKRTHEETDERFLDDYISDPTLFAEYPDLKRIRVVTYDNSGERVAGSYNYLDNQIKLNTTPEADWQLRDVMIHEVQHAIQHAEGFAVGGNKNTYRQHLASLKGKYDAWNLVREFEDKRKELGDDATQMDVYNAVRDEYFEEGMSFGDGFMPSRDSFDNGFNLWVRGYDKEGYKDAYSEYQSLTEKFGFGEHDTFGDGYRNLAGETEARNTQQRSFMTDEQRRASLRTETQDVADEDQVFLFDALERSDMGSRVEKRQQEIASTFKDRELNEQQRIVIDVFGGLKDNQKLVLNDADGGRKVVMMRRGNEAHGGTKHSIYRHYGRREGYITADDILKIPTIISSVEPTHEGLRRVYKKEIDGVEHTVLTEKKGSQETFMDFYTNRKAPVPDNPSYTHSAQLIRNDAYPGGKGTNNDAISQDNGSNLRLSQSERDSYQQVNAKFNEQLEQFHEQTADKTIFDLGTPSAILRSAGVRNLPMRLYGNKVLAKMKKHGFDISELRNLPLSVADPIAVFETQNKEYSRAVLTELRTNSGNFLVTLKFGREGNVDFNIVSSVYGKRDTRIVDWLNKGLAKYIDKEKALNYLTHSAPIAESLNNQELSSAAKVIEDFENPTIHDGNIRLRKAHPREQEYQRIEQELGTAAARYERAMDDTAKRMQEVAQDSLISVRELQDALSEQSGKPIQDYENAYWASIQYSSFSHREIHSISFEGRLRFHTFA